MHLFTEQGHRKTEAWSCLLQYSFVLVLFKITSSLVLQYEARTSYEIKAQTEARKNNSTTHTNASSPTTLKWCHNLSSLFKVKFNITIALNTSFLTLKNTMAWIFESV